MHDPVSVAKSVLDQQWDRAFPVDLELIAKLNGISVVPVKHIGAWDEDISGMITYEEGKPTIYIRKRDTIPRQRFTLAHELGHFFLHEGKRFRDNYASTSSSNYDVDEVAANAFAAELLMPSLAVEYFITKENLKEVDELANVFKVSLKAMTYRLVNLGWLPSWVI